MPVKRQVIERLFELKGEAKKENKQYVSDVISLYRARKIEQPARAITIARKLARTKAQVPGGLALLETYKETACNREVSTCCSRKTHWTSES